LLAWLNTADSICLEAGSLATRIARQLRAELPEASITLLDPKRLAIIYLSLKKTDQEDALKLARMVQRFKFSELPTVTITSEQDQERRALAVEFEFIKMSKNKYMNRMHALFTRAGITKLLKRNLSSEKNRRKSQSLLPAAFHCEFERINAGIILLESQATQIEEQMRTILKQESAFTEMALSLPGIGLVTAFVLLAYLGDCSRFPTASQASAFVGLVPRIDCSGDTQRYGRIVRGCRPVKRIIFQSAWTTVRSSWGGDLKAFYLRKYPQIGKKKAIVATARKLIEVFHTMMRNGEMYRFSIDELISSKREAYGLIWPRTRAKGRRKNIVGNYSSLRATGNGISQR